MHAMEQTPQTQRCLKLNNDRGEHKLCQFILNLFHSIFHCCARSPARVCVCVLGAYAGTAQTESGSILCEKIISQ